MGQGLTGEERFFVSIRVGGADIVQESIKKPVEGSIPTPVPFEILNLPLLDRPESPSFIDQDGIRFHTRTFGDSNITEY